MPADDGGTEQCVHTLYADSKMTRMDFFRIYVNGLVIFSSKIIYITEIREKEGKHEHVVLYHI